MKHRFVVLVLTISAIPHFAAAQQRQAPERLVQYPARGTRGAVAAGSNWATDAGMRMYYTGGNAVDAGVNACKQVD
jgi:gamma-glutamyltranspeptidase